MIELIRSGKTDEAGALLFDNNPLTAITGAVCPNHLFCKGTCVLGRKGNPVDFSKIEREVSKKYLETEELPRFTENNKRVLIVGSGPAGIALAYYLRKQGFSVEVWEKEKQLGGMLRYGIPDFRLDKSLIDKVVSRLEKFGVRFRADSPVDLKNLPDGFDITVLAIGAGVSKKLDIEGSELAVPALEYLQNGKEASGNVIVIGAGNVAIDCALTAAAYGAASVSICYRKDEAAMKAYPDELKLARNKGIVFNYFMVPKIITKKGVTFDKQGQEVFMPADKVIVAIGQTATEDGLIKPEELGTNVYAIGDAVTGTSTIIEVVAAAKQLAEKIIG